MGFHDSVRIQNCFKDMIKSSGHVKYFRHQCKALIQISRHFWEFVAIMEGDQYTSFQKFVATADRALQAVAGYDTSINKKTADVDMQEKLDEAILELMEYWKDLSSLDDYDPQMMMIKARAMDEERKKQIITVDEIKKVQPDRIHSVELC
ncbi:unnamed protein product [Rhizoctonia solani]|uniref:Uncharacterized protein n=1 Tax=Rhizoctonia solani TaxID=456999 RepID=A0A8H2XAT0_9AGAM|nr:unnamed protein product [Rhizoctonia solani]